METAIKQIDERIARTCQRCAREPDEIKLIAVSKTVAPRLIEEAYRIGLRSFGENTAQEFREKVLRLPGDVEWHFIGHLQTNKIKYVAGRVKLFQALDSLSLADALSQYAIRHGLVVEALLQVNTSREATKFGFDPDLAEDSFGRIAALPGIAVKGLMTIGPFTEATSEIRQAFRKLKNLQGKLNNSYPSDKTSILSMGMSHDFEIAIEEGSTMVRIGTAIFGAREVV